MRANLLVLDGQVEAEQAEVVESRKIAKVSDADAHPLHRVLDQVDASIARAHEGITAQSTLKAVARRPARLPLVPDWFSL